MSLTSLQTPTTTHHLPTSTIPQPRVHCFDLYISQNQCFVRSFTPTDGNYRVPTCTPRIRVYVYSSSDSDSVFSTALYPLLSLYPVFEHSKEVWKEFSAEDPGAAAALVTSIYDHMLKVDPTLLRDWKTMCAGFVDVESDPGDNSDSSRVGTQEESEGYAYDDSGYDDSDKAVLTHSLPPRPLTYSLTHHSLPRTLPPPHTHTHTRTHADTFSCTHPHHTHTLTRSHTHSHTHTHKHNTCEGGGGTHTHTPMVHTLHRVCEGNKLGGSLRVAVEVLESVGEARVRRRAAEQCERK
jgi:hypothetical protein